MIALTKYNKIIQKERNLSKFIPYSSHITFNTIMTKNGDYMRIWKVSGISHESADDSIIELRKDQLNTLLRNISSPHLALWTHTIRRKITDRLEAEFDNDFCRALDKRYFDSFTGYKMMTNELYLTLVYRPNPSKISKSFLKASHRTLEEIKSDQSKILQKLDELSYQVESSLNLYGCEALTTYKDHVGIEYSKILEFLNFLISGEWQKVRLSKIPLSHYLGTSWIFVGNETIELRTNKTTRFAQAIDFKDYTSYTEPGLLNSLFYEDYEYILTQSFSFFSKNEGKKYLTRQQRQLKNTEDGSATQIEEMNFAIDELIQGEFTMGEYHFTMLVFGETIDTVKRNVASSIAVIQDLGFLASVVSTATDAAFFAQLPANWFYRPRVAVLTSKNFAGLSSFHNFASGKRDGNPWGQAVTLFKTTSRQPFYFNFHASKDQEDVFDQKLLGNTCVIGQSGSGKTVLLGLLLCQSQKFKVNSPNGFTTIFFDKDRGAEILIRAIGGNYLTLQNGKPTGFNPFQMEATENNIQFLEKLVQKLITSDTQPITTSDQLLITHAVRTVMRMPKGLRRLSTVTQNMVQGTDVQSRDNSLIKRLGRWCQGGPLAWVLDNGKDELDFSDYGCYGIDGTSFLDNTEVRSIVAMYLLYRMESIIDGRRFMYFMDEFWKWLLDDYFSDFAFNKQKTIRKQNGLGIFATQSPSDVLKSPISRSIIEQCATEIYLPNPKADHDEYVNGFKVTETEFNLIKNLGEDSRMFLVKQNQQSAIAKLDLSGFDDELAVLSGSTDNIKILQQIINEFGENDPNLWLPKFHMQRKNRTVFNSLHEGV